MPFPCLRPSVPVGSAPLLKLSCPQSATTISVFRSRERETELGGRTECEVPSTKAIAKQQGHSMAHAGCVTRPRPTEKEGGTCRGARVRWDHDWKPFGGWGSMGASPHRLSHTVQSPSLSLCSPPRRSPPPCFSRQRFPSLPPPRFLSNPRLPVNNFPLFPFPASALATFAALDLSLASELGLGDIGVGPGREEVWVRGGKV